MLAWLFRSARNPKVQRTAIGMAGVGATQVATFWLHDYFTKKNGWSPLDPNATNYIIDNKTAKVQEPRDRRRVINKT